MKTAKLGALFVVFVMAFTAVAASYAHWEETLEISGIMTTDDIDPVFLCADSNDDPNAANPLADRLDPDECGDWTDFGTEWLGGRRDKDVGSMSAFIPAGGKSIVITILDAYPCYYSKAYWCTKNDGSCPVLIHSVKLVDLSYTRPDETIIHRTVDVNLIADQKVFVQWYKDANNVMQVYTYVGIPTDRENYDFYILPQDDFAIDTQLDPIGWIENPGAHMESGYTSQLDHGLCVHFENGCEQEQTYDFTIELCFYNWPELA